MADIIQFMNAESLTQTAGALTQAVSGMSAAEASAAMGATASTGAKIINFTSKTAAGANNIINFPNAATAAEAAEAYVTAGGTVSEVGAATSAAGAAETVGNFTIIEGGAAGAGATGVGGILSMSLPTAAAAIAPLAGVALGAGLYNLNPELWTKISKALLPFCYDDTELLPVTVDSSGQAYFPQGAIDAVKEVLSQGDFTPSAETASTFTADISNVEPSINVYARFLETASDEARNVASINNTRILTVLQNHPNWLVRIWYSTPLLRVFCEKIENTLIFNTVTAGGGDNTHVASYKAPDSYRQWFNTDPEYNDVSTGPYTDNWWYNSGYAPYKKEAVSKWGFIKAPEGVNVWSGQSVPDGTTGINVLTGFDADGNPIYTPYYPVQIPIGDPGVSANPEEQPNPVAPSTNPAIEPWISPNPWSIPNTYPTELPVTDPTPAPLPNPVPDSPTDAVPNPDTNPSQDPVDKPNDGKNPDAPQSPTDKGTGENPIIPVVPPIVSGGARGLLTVYNPTLSQLNQFGQWLWATPLSQDIGTEFLKMFADPMDAVIGLHEIYATPTNSGESTIKAGYFDSNVPSAVVGNRYIEINCGSIVVEEYYQNYLDYSPYTRCFIYLPFIGIVPASANDIIGNAVNIKYHVDLYNGSCIAVVTVAKQNYSSTVYQFNGNCAVDLPITSAYNSVVRNAMMGMVSGAIMAGGGGLSLAGGLAGAARGAAHSEINVQHSGSFGASYGAMGAKIPYIIVKRPVQKIVYNYSESYGYPAHKMVYVGNCSGYLRAREVRILSTTATNEEKDMIVSALKQGVYVK